MYALFLKRVGDFLVAFGLLILLSPLFAATYVLVFASIGSPVFFRQKRPGFKGKIFEIYKFRTMSEARDENGELLGDEVRLTTLGKILRKLSLDELPQLINILKGEMSFVGPRPLLPEYLPLYNARQASRHDVLPGITGLAQINGRNAISWQEKLELDVVYVENISLLLDVKIAILTIWRVFKADGVSKEGMATTDKFRGNEA